MISWEARQREQLRPESPVVMTQRWQSLLFLHSVADPELVQRLLPPGLTVDRFPDESGTPMAWIGLVPFWMRDVRWTGVPPFPGYQNFLETNLRTYVIGPDGRPGVWFFSLDASKLAVVAAARLTFRLPYFYARMRASRTPDAASYLSVRKDSTQALFRSGARFGHPEAAAEAESLEFFLLERYRLYSHKNGQLFSGQVHHAPYMTRPVTDFELDETLRESFRLPDSPIVHACFCEGVNVEVFGIHPV